MCRVYELLTRFSAGIVYLLYKLFDEVGHHYRLLVWWLIQKILRGESIGVKFYTTTASYPGQSVSSLYNNTKSRAHKLSNHALLFS